MTEEQFNKPSETWTGQHGNTNILRASLNIKQPEPMTAHELLKGKTFRANMAEPPGGKFNVVHYDDAVAAINEYASEQTAQLRKENEELKKTALVDWKEYNKLKQQADEMAKAIEAYFNGTEPEQDNYFGHVLTKYRQGR